MPSAAVPHVPARQNITDAQAITSGTLTDYQRDLFYRPTNRGTARSITHQNHALSDDPELFREVVAAFVCVLRDYYAQDVKVAWILKRRIEVTGTGYRGELLDLFYRCVFEGLNLAPEGEALSRPR